MTAAVLHEVRLHGVLGERFGRVHRLAVRSAAEAIRALCVTVDGFEAWLRRHSEPGYHVFVDHRNIGERELVDPVGRKEVIRIVPAITGAKRAGVLQVIVGAVLVVVGTYFGQAWMVQAGVAMMLGGVLTMLSPQRTGQDETIENKPSYAFSGPVNVETEGGPVPLGYGRMIVGSVVISGGISTDDISPAGWVEPNPPQLPREEWPHEFGGDGGPGDGGDGGDGGGEGE